MTVAVVNTDERCVQVNYGPPFGFKTQVFRQLTPERNPDVLMRAMEIALRNTIIGMFDEMTAKYAIEQAMRELESEAGK